MLSQDRLRIKDAKKKKKKREKKEEAACSERQNIKVTGTCPELAWPMCGQNCNKFNTSPVVTQVCFVQFYYGIHYAHRDQGV